MVERGIEEFGAIDILVNNAGVASRGGNVADTDPAEEIDRLFDTHAFGVVGVFEARPPVDADTAARRHRHDLERRDPAHGGLTRRRTTWPRPRWRRWR